MNPHSKSSTFDSSAIDDLVERIEEKHFTFMEKAKWLGATHSAGGKYADAEHLTPGIDPILTDYQSLTDDIDQTIKPDLQQRMGSLEREEGQVKASKLNVDAGAKASAVKIQEHKLESKPAGIDAILPFCIGILVTIIIGISEAIFLAASLQVAGKNWGFSILLSFGLSIGVAIILKFARPFVEGITSPILRRLVTILIATLIIGLPLTLAYMRVLYINKTGGNVSPSFVLVTMLTLTLALYFNARYFLSPSFEAIKKAIQALKERRKLKQQKNEVTALIVQKDEVETGLSDSLKRRLEFIYDAQKLEVKVDTYYHMAVSAYKQAFIASHQGPLPKWISEEPPQLTFYAKHIIH